jgi:GYF domain 2
MADRWLVRVGEKEYGPVDVDTLAVWKREGRLLPTNEVRRESDSAWTIANTIPELFGPPPVPAEIDHPLRRRRSFGEIIRDSFTIYKSAFLPFFVITLLIAIPPLVIELTSPAYGIFPQVEGTSGLTRARVIALFGFIALVVNWPVFLAGIQIATVDVLEGRKVRLGELLRRAANFFPRFARLGLVVYGSYFLCAIFPVAITLSLVSASETISPIMLIFSLVLALLILGVAVIMLARLWVNFLFWQQSAYISNLEGAEALRESKLLARSQRRPRKSARPLWRGALLASLWVLIVLGLSAGAEIPLIFSKFQNVSTAEEMLKVLQNLDAPKAADAMLIGSMVVSSLVRALMRPILGIAFVLLYLDARADFTESELAPPDRQSS